jgi:membrane dipeptidase
MPQLRAPLFVGAYALAFGLACGPSPAPAATPTAREASPSAPPSAASAAPASSAAAPAAPPKNETIEERAARLHRQAIIVDGHDDVPSVIFATGQDIGDRAPKGHTDLPRMKAGGITGSFFSIYVEGDLATKPTLLGGGALRRAVDLVDVTYRQVERHPDELVLATSTDDIRRAKREGKIAVLMGIEGGHAIENSLSALRVLHRLGCRYMTLTHTNTNEWADSSGFAGPTPTRHHGLTKFGEEVVREMQRIGMLVDVSHVADETFWSVMKVAKAPVIASHSSARAVADHRRNLNDDMLRALAKNGGVAMVNFWSLFVSQEYATAAGKWFAKNGKALGELRAKYKDDPVKFREELEKLKAQGDPMPKVPLSAIVDHIDHVVKVAGIDHVGLGSDFDGVDALPEGLEGIDGLPKITLELVKRGYKDDEVLKILGENFLRAFGEAERYAKQTKTTLSGDGSTKRIDRP